MSQQKIDALKNEIYEKLEELRELAVETDTVTYFEMGPHTFQVLLESQYDEETLEYLVEEGAEVGEWISSSELC